MPLASETVTISGSGLVFENTYGAGVTDAFRAAIVAAENSYQSQFSNAATIALSFDQKPMSAEFSGHNDYAVISVSYAQLVAALTAHATTADDLAAVAGLPASDPSGGLGFWMPTAQARMLGLTSDPRAVDDTITLNSDLPWMFGADAIGVLEHEISEGALGRVGSLGLQKAGWQAMDLFRFTAEGVRDYTGGADGVATYFGTDGQHLVAMAFHGAISASGANDGFDLADWDQAAGDAYGPGGPGLAGAISATDLRIIDILGWTPASGALRTAAAPASHADGEHLAMPHAYWQSSWIFDA